MANHRGLTTPLRTELRVHGVSGTPPRKLLYWDPVTYPEQGHLEATETKVWERSRDQVPEAATRVRAFHWGSLTSGSRLSAFWLLLAPFAFANVAGWMADGRRWPQAMIRLSGLGMSSLFAAQASVIGVGYTSQLVANGIWPGWSAVASPLALAGLLVVAGWRLSARSQLSPLTPGKRMALVFGVTTRSLLPPAEAVSPDSGADELLADPAPGATLADPAMWEVQAVLHRLRRLHLATAVLVVAVAVSWGGGLEVQSGLAVGVLAIIASATTFTFGKGVIQQATVMVARLALWASIGVLMWSVAGLDPSALPGGPWPHTHEIVFYAAGVTLSGALLASLIMAASGTAPGQALIPAGAVTVGTLFGGALGAGSALLAEFAIARWVTGATGFQPLETFEISMTEIMVNGGSWVAVAMVAFVLGIVAIGAITAVIPGAASLTLPGPRQGRGVAMLRRVTLRAHIILAVTGSVGLTLAAVAGVAACVPDSNVFCYPGALEVSLEDSFLVWVALGLFAIAAVALVVATAHLNGAVAGLVAIGAGMLFWMVWTGPPPFDPFNIPILKMPVDLTEVVDLSMVLMGLGLTLLILRSVIGGIGDPERRRRVGILWDTGSFWPRWFHPLAPPAYGPHAVVELRRQIPATADKPFVLTAHSQGSVIAVCALAKSERLPEGLLTYGSPLGHLYRRLFSATGVTELSSGVAERLGTRWINLWRDTDFLGGLEVPHTHNWLIETGVGHSRYELTPEYCEARKRAIDGNGEPPGEVGSDCWET